MVAPEGGFANLKARVGDDPTIPPTTGWMFQNFDSKKFEEDPHLTCSSVMTAFVSCSITVSLSGLAKDIQGECEAEYKDSGLHGKTGAKLFNKSICSFRTSFRCSNWRALLTAGSLDRGVTGCPSKEIGKCFFSHPCPCPLSLHCS